MQMQTTPRAAPRGARPRPIDLTRAALAVRLRPARGLALAGVAASTVWALVPAGDASPMLRVGLVTLLCALAVAAFTAAASEAPDA